jgi:hypothetical protein
VEWLTRVGLGGREMNGLLLVNNTE